MELNFEKIKVLLVDDDENFGFALKTLLKSKGLEIESLTNPEEALENLKNNHFDMILLDYYMPQMTGEQFLTKLREFNKDTIVFLQTAFSEEKPEFEMLQSLNIQGYIDKNKDPNDIFLDIVSGVKMANLLNLIRKQEKEISILNYKKAIVGDLISQLVNESKDQLFQIGGMVGAIENDTDTYSEEIDCIKKATSKINELYDALNFESEETMTIEQFKTTINELLKAKLLIHNAKLEFNIVNKWITIDNKANELVYSVIKIIELILLLANAKNIVLTAKEQDNTKTIEISSENSCSNINLTEVREMNPNVQIEFKQAEDKITIII